MNVTKTTTVREVMEYWLLKKERASLKPTSFDRKVNTVKYQVLPFIGSLPARSLTVDHIDAMVEALRKKGYSYSTIKKAVEAVNGCYRFLRARKKLSCNPTEGFNLGKGPRPGAKVKCYTFEQSILIQHESQRKYKNGAPIYPHGELIVLLLNTGLRIGELIALSWSDINLSQRIISVNKSAVRIKRMDTSSLSGILEPAPGYQYDIVIQDSTKTGAGERSCPLNNAAYAALLRLAARNGQRGLVAKTSTGAPLHPSNLTRTLARITRNCNFPKEMRLGPHSLRHTFATCLLQKGADIKKVSELLGHSSVQITYDYYVHYIPSDYVSTVKLLEEPSSQST